MAILQFDAPNCVCNFIRVRKTGSTSIIDGLFGGADVAKVISRDGVWLPEFEGHYTAAFVRNPFERMASCLRMFQGYKIKNAAEEAFRAELDLHRLMDVIENEEIPLDGYSFLSKLRSHAVPMTHPFYKLDRVNFTGRFEEFEVYYDVLCDVLEIDWHRALHARPSKTASQAEPVSFADYFTPDTRARAERLLRDDLDRYGYSFTN